MEIDRTRCFYEDWARKEIATFSDGRELTLKWKAKVLAGLVPKDWRLRNLLDIGCAEGTLIDELKRLLQIEFAVGIDIAGNFINSGKHRYREIHFLQNDGNLPFKDKSFELTICSDFIEHTPEISKYLLEIKRVSKFILFKIPVESCLTGNIFRTVGLYPKVGIEHPSGHLHLFSKTTAQEVVEKSGFSIIHFSFEITPPIILYQNVSRLRRYLNPVTYLEMLSRRLYPKGHLRLMGGNLFALCEG